jgi:hypothetical protein
MKLAVCIRGHIRHGLADSRLRNYLNLLKEQGHNIDLFLHTWSESEAKSSYRKLNSDSIFPVTAETLKDYFKEFIIKQIIVDDDSKLQLHGDLRGKIGKCPKIAWKRMWAGKFKLASHLYHNHTYDYDLVINTRYDKFTTPVCYTPVKNLLNITMLKEGLSLKYPQYYKYIKGVDNYYCGSIQSIYDITCAFHYSLDEIASNYNIRSFHEELFYKYAIDNCLVK